MNKKIYVVDSQILNMATECQRKANYTFNKNLVPVIIPDFFEKGDLVHQILAQYYKLRRYRSRWQVNHKSHADILDACIRVGRRAAIRMHLDIETVEDVVRACTEYMTYYANDDWNNVIAVEEVGSKILYEDELMIILYQFKIDLILALTNCPILPIDHKSSSRRQEANEMSNQFKGYCWGLGVNNICINKVGFQTSLKPSEKFSRDTISYPPQIIEEWIDVSVYYLKKYISDGEINFYPPNFTSCDKYSGCIFKKVCRSVPEVRDYKLMQLFEEKEKWDVGATAPNGKT